MSDILVGVQATCHVHKAGDNASLSSQGRDFVGSG
jgi:hypothetical protein